MSRQPHQWSLKGVRSDKPYPFLHYTSGLPQPESPRKQPPQKNDHEMRPQQEKDSVSASSAPPMATHLLHGTPNNAPCFAGTYGHLRQRLDYSYHSYYRKERQWLHDAILADSLLQHSHGVEEGQETERDVPNSPEETTQCSKHVVPPHRHAYGSTAANIAFHLDSASASVSTRAIPEAEKDDEDDDSSSSASTAPWLILLAGVHGAGKHTTVRKLVAARQLRLRNSFVCIDMDDLRRYLPEYATYLRQDPTHVNAWTRQEAGYLAETLVQATLQAGRHAIWHCRLASPEWYIQQYLPSLRRQFPGLHVALIHVTADIATVLPRARHRAAPRPIDASRIRKALTHDIPEAVNAVRPHVDYCCTLRNNYGSQLEIVDGDWATFGGTFNQFSLQANQSSSQDRESNSISCARRGAQQVLESGLVPTPAPPPSTPLPSYNVFRSTTETNRVTNQEFYGEFAHIRSTLDYTFHSNYTFARQRLQDAIIRSFLEAALVRDHTGRVCSTPTRPWIVFTAGAMGAGKGYTVARIVQQGHFPLLAFVQVNTDAIRHKLPEYSVFVRHCPEQAGQLTHGEAGYVAEILTLASLSAGKNVIVDGSLRRTEWYRALIGRLRRQFEDLRIAILHVTAPKEAVLARAAARAEETGRIVPRETLLQALEQVPRSVQELAPLVDYHVEICNPPDSDLELVTPGETWETFRSHWVQSCAWVAPKSQTRLIKKSREIERHLVDALET